jgi:hypothetical protein
MSRVWRRCTKCGRLTDCDPDNCYPGMCAGCSNTGLDKDARITQLETELAAAQLESSELRTSQRWFQEECTRLRSELSEEG